MDLPPVRKAGMFRVMGYRPLLKPGHAGIVHDDIGNWSIAGQLQPICFLSNIKLLEATSDFGGRGSARIFVNVRHNDDATLAVKALSYRSPDAPCCTRNNAHLANKSFHVVTDHCSRLEIANAHIGLAPTSKEGAWPTNPSDPPPAPTKALTICSM